MNFKITSLTAAIRGALRVSSLLRVLWMAVALLHVWLIVRRCIAGEWHGAADYVRGLLCLVAVSYATLKVWRVATVFDNEPRRAWVFGLVLLLGHTFSSQPSHEAQSLAQGETAALVAALAILPAAELALGLALLVLALRGRLRAAADTFLGLARPYGRAMDAIRPRLLLLTASPPLRGPPACSC